MINTTTLYQRFVSFFKNIVKPQHKVEVNHTSSISVENNCVVADATAPYVKDDNSIEVKPVTEINQNSTTEIPEGVQNDIGIVLSEFDKEIHSIDKVDPIYNHIVEALDECFKNIEEEAQADGYIFDRDEFVATLPFIVEDQLSAIKKEKLSPQQWSERFNRWFVFCDAVANLGISILKNKEALQKDGYEDVLSTLKLNKQFESTFLKPNKLRVEFTSKNRTIKEDYKWLAMPCLIVTDDEGKEHKIAITPSPVGRVWWLEILTNFHNSYQWANELLMEQKDYEEAPYHAFGEKKSTKG